jgi:hypothetical protein
MRGGNIGRVSPSIGYTVMLWTIGSTASGHDLSGRHSYPFSYWQYMALLSDPISTLVMSNWYSSVRRSNPESGKLRRMIVLSYVWVSDWSRVDLEYLVVQLMPIFFCLLRNLKAHCRILENLCRILSRDSGIRLGQIHDRHSRGKSWRE